MFYTPRYAAFLLGDECDGLDALLARPYFAPLVHAEPRCFEVRSRLGAGMGVLGAASLLQMALGNAVMRRSRAALDDHERQLGRSPRGAAPHERRARPLAADGRAQPLLAD